MIDVRTPRGTNDILPEEAELWRRFERTAADVMRLYGFGEIRTPVFEHTDLFVRGVGETSDIVEKQMYTFQDRGDRSLTLRPEGTAPVVRAFVQHRMHGLAMPQKLWYIQPMFRYERPQLGRGRQFHQFGAEMIGSVDPACDAEVIAAGVDVFRRLGVTEYVILINSIGCDACRPDYRRVLVEFIHGRFDDICSDCQNRYERNPLRVLDCKDERCQKVTEAAPTVTDHLCGPCRAHFAAVKQLLQKADIDYRIDERLVRGLDYYTKTVFEFVTERLGAQGTILAGGRYDGLVEELGGPSLPAVGFGAGIERAIALLQLEKEKETVVSHLRPDVFIVTVGPDSRDRGLAVALELRRAETVTAIDYDHQGDGEDFTFSKSIRSQLKAAHRSKAKIALIIGEEEIARDVVTVRQMESADQKEVPMGEVVSVVKEILGSGSGEEVVS